MTKFIYWHLVGSPAFKAMYRADASETEAAVDKGSGNTVEITAGDEVEKYAASAITSEGGRFTASLTVRECAAEEALNTFYLHVENSEGSQKYFYSLIVNDKETGGGGGGGETNGGGGPGNGTETGGSGGDGGGGGTAAAEKPGLSPTVVGLIVVGLAVIACLGVGMWFFYERKRARVNAGPLGGQELRPS